MSWRSEEAERQKVVEEEEQQDDGQIVRLVAATPTRKRQCVYDIVGMNALNNAGSLVYAIVLFAFCTSAGRAAACLLVL